MKQAFALGFGILVLAMLVSSVSAASWYNIETWSFSLNAQANPYTYIFHGPFIETGVAYAGLINVTVSFQDQAPVRFSLSNGGDYTFTSQRQAVAAFWNLTSDYNHSRQIAFRSGFTDELYLYVGGSGDLLGIYGVEVTDFAGLTNATVEVDKNVLGVNQVVERQNLDIVNTMNFYLVMYSQYLLKIVSDQGIFTWNLIADATATKNFLVTPSMVTETNQGTNITVSATRLNATSANVYFNDPSHDTVSVTSSIYVLNRTGQYLFFTQTDSGYVQNVTVYSLDANTNYFARTVTVGGSWTNQLPTVVSEDNWGVSFNVFGDWAYLAKNVVGMFVVMTLICIGSWKDTELFLGAGILVAAFLVYYGFLSVPWAGISAALLVVVLMYIDKAKKELPYS